VHDFGARGIHSLAIAREENEDCGQWWFLGMIAFLDPLDTHWGTD
jgi:hypothetical protein